MCYSRDGLILILSGSRVSGLPPPADYLHPHGQSYVMSACYPPVCRYIASAGMGGTLSLTGKSYPLRKAAGKSSPKRAWHGFAPDGQYHGGKRLVPFFLERQDLPLSKLRSCSSGGVAHVPSGKQDPAPHEPPSEDDDSAAE